MKSIGSELRRKVVEALEAEAGITEPHVGVAVFDGVVRLMGTVRSLPERQRAEKAARSVAAAHAIANEIVLGNSRHEVPRDVEIARDALRALQSSKSVPAGVQVTADHGWIALDGNAETKHQKLAAYRAVRELPGVLGVMNRLTLPPEVVIDEIEARILDAFKRVARVDAQGIDIEVTDDEVVLHGYVQSEAERAQADEVAQAAPGVGRVTNELVVRAM